MVVAKKWIYAKAFSGLPTVDNFRLEEETLGEIGNNEFLAEAICLSVDPYMRPYMSDYPIGSTLIGGQIAMVVESKNPKFPLGSHVHGNFGWRTHTICDPDNGDPRWRPYVLPDFGTEPFSLGLGILGMPGNTAYFGFLEICKPKKGETVVVSGAAGAVGSVVGQIARIKGCYVVGICGSDDKCRWLMEIGYDCAINYKTASMEDELKVAAPKGVDCYFDNVGGKITEIVRGHMNTFGRISVCGAISNYNSGTAIVADPQWDFVTKQLRQEGFIGWTYMERWQKGIQQILQWIRQGKMRYKETRTEGFENMPKAFIGMLSGENMGKAIVYV